MASVPDVNVPSVSPAGPANDYQTEQASPAAFGGQTAQASERLGQAVSQSGQSAFDTALQQQGQINETLATNGETKAMSQYADTVGKYKSLEGLAAVAAKPHAIADLTSIRQNILKEMPSPQAQKAFNTLALRHEAMALEDVSSYSSQQVKAADNNSAVASIKMNTARAGAFSVASNDDRFNDTLRDNDFQVARLLQNQGYGPDGGTGMTQNPKTGDVTFDENKPEGRKAKAIADKMLSDARTDAWLNRIDILTNDPSHGDPLKANQVYQAAVDRGDIPPAAQAKISAFLVTKVRNAQTRSFADQDNDDLDNQYHAYVTGGSSPSSPNNPGNVKAAGGSGFLNPATPVDGVIATANNLRSGYTGMTIAQMAPKWTGENGQKVQDWISNVSHASGLDPNTAPNLNDSAVLHSLVKGIATAEKSPQDRAAFTDDIITQGVQGTLSGKKANLIPAGNQTVAAPANPISKADFYRQNFAPIMKEAETKAAQLFPNDPIAQDQYISRRQTGIQREITAQDMAYTADIHTVQTSLVTPMKDGTLPTTPDQLSPDARQAYTRSQIQNPQAAMGMDRVMAANAKGQSVGYGSNFNSYLERVLAPQGDPTRIVDPNELAKNVYGGEDGPLTNTGLRELQNIIGQRGTPQGDAMAAQMTSFLKAAHGMISGQTAAIADPKGEKLYGDFLKHAIPQIVAAQRSGGVAQVFDRKGDLYNSITNFMRPTQTQANDYIYRQDVKAADNWEDQTKQLKLDDPANRQQALNSLLSLVKQGKVQKPQAQQLALRYQLVAPNPPSVPLPQ